MILKKKIPKEFYKLFRTKNRDAYMQFLVAIYEENNEVYTALGLTIEECRVIIADTIAKARIIWEDEDELAVREDAGILLKEDTRNKLIRKNAGLLEPLKEAILKSGLTIEQERLL